MNTSTPSPRALSIPDLAGKAILVTGASTGIGAAVALALGQQGAIVAVHYNASAEAAEKLAADIKAHGGTAVLVQGDMGADGVSEKVVEDAAKQLGGLDGLINNAGGMLGRIAFADITNAHYEKVMNLNARSVLAATQAAVPFLKERRGFVINTTSIAARHGGGPGSTIYAASKGFVSTITRGHAKELVGFGIRVNAVSPGVIATPFTSVIHQPSRWKPCARPSPWGASEPPKNASAPICSWPRRPSRATLRARSSRSTAAS